MPAAALDIPVIVDVELQGGAVHFDAVREAPDVVVVLDPDPGRVRRGDVDAVVAAAAAVDEAVIDDPDVAVVGDVNFETVSIAAECIP